MGSATEDAERTRRIAAAAAASVQQLGSRPGMADVMRAKADSYAMLGVHVTARFLADKAVAAAPSDPDDILRLARVHALAGQHRRALHLLTSSNITERSLVARLLSAQCFFAVGDFEDCLAILRDTENESPRTFENAENDRAVENCRRLDGAKLFSQRMPGGIPSPTSMATSAYADTPEIRAALCLMRAKVFEELENSERAAWWYKRALVWDVYCYEAFMCLTETGLISVDDASQFSKDLLNFGLSGNSTIRDIDSSSVNSVWLASDSTDGRLASGRRSARPRPSTLQHATTAASSSEASVWMSAFYIAQVDRSGPTLLSPVCAETTSEKNDVDVGASMQRASSHPLEFVLSEPRLRNNVDIMALRARRHFDILNFEECLRVTRSILSRDPFVDKRVLLVHLAALVELDERHELFVIAHTLVEKSPREACSWLAVGYYYFSCSKFELARRYLQKATSLYARLGPAWLAIGHAFASQDESDHAMAAYRTASRLLPNAPLPPLFMGMEYVRQSSLTHASSFFQIAREACPMDPAPRHELGVVAYRTGDLHGAVAFFKTALSLWETGDCAKTIMPCGGRRAEAEEATIFNLGHCYRRLREFDRAKRCYERALGLRPRSTSTCNALGITLHAMGDHSGAVAMYHRALRYSPDDTMSSLLLERALEDLCSEAS
jgi:anaphase-promoting complex subunit 6